MIVFLAILFILVPVGIIYLTEKITWLNKIGPVIIAYILGVVLGNSGILPQMGDNLKEEVHTEKNISLSKVEAYEKEGVLLHSDILAFKVYKLQDLFTSLTILLALPLLLFSVKADVWVKMSGKTMLSMLLALVSVVVFIVLGYVWFGRQLTGSYKIAGMLVGLYTGGTPNLATLKQTLGVDTETYIMTHTYDTIVGIMYLLFLVSVGKTIFRKLLNSYPQGQNNRGNMAASGFTENNYKGIFSAGSIIDISKSLVITFIIVGISVAFGYLFESYFMLAIMLTMTTLSILAALIRAINTLQKTFELGMYFIVVFSFVVATMANIQALAHVSSTLLAYITLVYVGTLTLHFILCKIFRVDADTLMVTSTALLCSPPFVPMVATSLKNKEVILSGLAVGITGYAIGNYMGILIAAFLK